MVTSEVEAASAQLHDKTSLSCLILEWNTDGCGGAKEKTSEDVLQALRPCPTLHQLEIKGYPGRKVPTWLGDSTCPTLQELYLESWEGCTNLPALGNLSELRQLEIEGMPKVRRVGAEWFGSNHAFPKLENLRFAHMAGWEDWDSLDEKLFFSFPCLSELFIWICPKLRSPVPEIHVDEWPNLEEKSFFPCLSKLEIWNCPKLRSLPSLPNLEHLTIGGDNGMSELSYDLVNKLGALKRLEIRNCLNLESLPQEMASLKQLQTLVIWFCPKLKESCNKDGAQWYKIQHIPSIIINNEDVRRNA